LEDGSGQRKRREQGRGRSYKAEYSGRRDGGMRMSSKKPTETVRGSCELIVARESAWELTSDALLALRLHLANESLADVGTENDQTELGCRVSRVSESSRVEMWSCVLTFVVIAPVTVQDGAFGRVEDVEQRDAETDVGDDLSCVKRV
jgi:hypothetical protein